MQNYENYCKSPNYWMYFFLEVEKCEDDSDNVNDNDSDDDSDNDSDNDNVNDN